MNPKKITFAREIFERKEREEQEKKRRNVIGFIANIPISKEATEKIRKYFEEESKKAKRNNDLARIKKSIGSIFFLLALFTATLGCIWLIKIFWKGIFG